MAVAVLECVMCKQSKTRGRWPDGFWASDCCQDCVEFMCKRIVEFRVKEAKKKGLLPF